MPVGLRRRRCGVAGVARLAALAAVAAAALLCAAAVLLAPCVCATRVRYRGSVYRGVTQADVREGGATLSVQVSLPAFPADEARLRWTVAQLLSTNVRLVDDDGVIVNSTANYWATPGAVGAGGGAAAESAGVLAEWLLAAEAISARSDVSVSDGGRELRVRMAGVDWELPPRVGVLVVPCLPFELFGEEGQIGVLDMPNNCLAGDPFMVRRAPFVHLDAARWRERGDALVVTGNAIEVPLAGAAQDTLDKFLIERDLRVVEGSTCLHTRGAFVRGSVWDMHRRVYRYTPHRGGVQTLCYTPYPETLPLLRVKLTDSLEVAGPEGVSTDPPQVRAELEFVGTIFGTNLTERDTAVMTDELCSDFRSQNVFFVELFFSSPTRASFFGTFHKRGIYHVCYHRAGSSAYVRVSTLLVEKGTELVIDSESTNVLIDQDVKLLESAAVARLKVQDKGSLNLRRRSLNVSYFVWSGGTISGRGTINCTGFGKITTQGYETRQLSVPLHNYGEMTIDAQRLLLDRDGAIHNYGNLTLAVSSMGADGISSVLSMGRHNTINNHAGGVLRVVALDERSYSLLTSRIVAWEGRVLVSGRVNVTDLSSGVLSSVVVRRGAMLTTYNARLAGRVSVEGRASLSLMEGSVLMATTVDGAGTVRVLGEGVMLDSVNVSGSVSVQVGGALPPAVRAGGGRDAGGAAGGDEASMTVSVYGVVVFGAQTHVGVGYVSFVTTTGMAKLLFHGSLSGRLDVAHFGENMFVRAGGTTVLYGAARDGGARWHARLHGEAAVRESAASLASAAAGAGGGGAAHGAVASLFVPPDATLFAIDTAGIGGGARALEVPCASYWTVSDYVALAGRGVLRGCFGIAHGASVGGTFESLVREEDWETVLSVACRGAFGGGGDGAPFCERGAVPPARAHSGLAVGGDVHVRAPAVVRVDELVVASGTTRSGGALSLRATDRVVVRSGAMLALGGGGHVEAREVVVEGTLEVTDPGATRVTGNVSVVEGGVVKIYGGAGVCHERLQLNGGWLVAAADSVQCGPALSASGGIVGRVALDTDASQIPESVRDRLLGGLPHSVACDAGVLAEMEEKRQMFDLIFKRARLTLHPSLPTWRGKTVGLLLAAFSAAATFLTLIRMWGSSVSEWCTDLTATPVISLPLTWYGFTYSVMNYLLFAIHVASVFQAVLAAFHPGLPAPLVTVASMCLRTWRLLTPHADFSVKRINTISLCVLLWCSLRLALFGRQVTRHAGRRGNRKNVFDIFLKTEAVGIVVITAVRTPLLSMLLDGAACSLVYPEMLSCAPFQNPWTFSLTLAAFFAVAIVVPWALITNEIILTHLELRMNVSFMLVTFSLTVLEVGLWKVFFNSPILHLACVTGVNVCRAVVLFSCRPTAYSNVDSFLRQCYMFPLMVCAGWFVQVIRARHGLLRSCTDGHDMFRFVFLASMGVVVLSFFRNIFLQRMSTCESGSPYLDTLHRSILQTRTRIHDLQAEVYATSDPVDRESILNATARLRIEYLEKRERFRLEANRILLPFYFGRKAFEVSESCIRSALLAALEEEGSGRNFGLGSNFSTSPNSRHPDVLSEEEMEAFSCGPALGKGSYGTVHLGILANGKLVAVKYVSVLSENREALASVMAEVNMLRELSHPNIIRYYGAHKIEDMMLLFMEFAVGGSLTSIVRKFTRLTDSVMQLYTYQILRGLQYLHSKGVVHRDIKGENILIDGYGVAKLSDFGCSKSLANIATGAEASGGTLVGSPFWMAPEVIRSEAYGTKADIWSVGCTVVEMLNGGDPPWRDEFDNVYSAMFYVGSTNDIPQIPEETSEECLRFLYRCFERDVSKRATADELLEHLWLSSAAEQTREDTDSFLHSRVLSSVALAPGSPSASGSHASFTALVNDGLHPPPQQLADRDSTKTSPG